MAMKIDIKQTIDDNGDAVVLVKKIKALSAHELPSAYIDPEKRNKKLFKGIGKEFCFYDEPVGLGSGYRRQVVIFDNEFVQYAVIEGDTLRYYDFKRIEKLIRKAGRNLMKINQRIEQHKKENDLDLKIEI